MIWPFATLFNDHAFAIRLPSLFFLGGILWLIFQLAKEMFSEEVARLATLLVFLVPLWGFASLGSLPDVPLAFFWLLSFYFFWQSVREDGKAWSVKKSWILIGLAMGLGMNSKLTCCLIGLGFGLYLMLTPSRRHHLLTPWPWLGMLITFVMMIPIFYWNAQHDWASFEYQFLRRHNEAYGADWNRWFQFWSYQWIFMSPGLYFLIACAFTAGFAHFKDIRYRVLSLVTFPALALFYYQPLMSAYKPHWSGPAYLVLFVGGIALFCQGYRVGNWQIIKPYSKVISMISIFFLLILNSVYIPLFTPIIPKLYQTFAKNPQDWQPKWDFSNEFYGWIELGDHLKKLRDQLPPEEKVFFGAQRYELISQLTWGTKEKVWQMTTESDQFYFDQPLTDKLQLRGQSAFIVNNDKYPRDPLDRAVFDSCSKTEMPIYRGATLARTFHIYYCKNFQGLK